MYASAPLDLFIDNGNIVWHTDAVAVVNFDNKGNPIAQPGVSQGLFLRWNIFVDGLFVPVQDLIVCSQDLYTWKGYISPYQPDTPTTRSKQEHIASQVLTRNGNIHFFAGSLCMALQYSDKYRYRWHHMFFS
jgi:hypothetical protein